MSKQTVVKLAYHRNGVSGTGFHVGIVNDNGEEMLVIRFPKERDFQGGGVNCAAFNLELLSKGIIDFGNNSFRGDHFHEVMDAAIEKKEVL